jgi:hypothetical protein
MREGQVFAVKRSLGALSLSEDLTEPDGYSLGELRKTLLVRDATIQRDLAEFIAGSRLRTDVLPR